MIKKGWFAKRREDLYCAGILKNRESGFSRIVWGVQKAVKKTRFLVLDRDFSHFAKAVKIISAGTGTMILSLKKFFSLEKMAWNLLFIFLKIGKVAFSGVCGGSENP